MPPWLPVGYKQWGAMQMWERIPSTRSLSGCQRHRTPQGSPLSRIRSSGFHFTPLCSWVGVCDGSLLVPGPRSEVSFFPAHCFANYSSTQFSEMSHVNVLSSSR